MKLTLNIGLTRPAGGENTIAETLAALPKLGEWKHRLNVGEWKGEPENTLVCQVEIPEGSNFEAIRSAIAATAEKLGQACIAASCEGKGELIPAVDEFKPEFFIAYDEKNEAQEFIAYLESTLIPDLKESGMNATAEDFEELIRYYRTK